MDDAESWFRQGNDMMVKEKNQEALEAYNMATEIDPNYVSAWNNKGIAFFRLRKFQDAIDCYDKVISINPNHANAWFNKAKALRGLGQTILDKANEDRVTAAKVINESLAVFKSAEECYSKGESLSAKES
ncbi:MAG TPA: tetratricopeptide repeat protein [Candidatus Nitrosotalea sp.]|nr:tetratricopeptide repeat protein [Candidatus Nitrosotalea sp.]